VLSGFDLDLSLWVALAVAAVICGFFIAARVHYLAIPKLSAVDAASSPADWMVVIPARNEEFFIARAVSSFPHDTVIVVDDQSEDRTAEAARKAGAGVMPAPEPARGAVGKANACMAGARVLNSHWILFADADTWFAPGFLESAVACAEASSLAFLSIYLAPEPAGWTERLLAPYAAALYFCGITPRGDPTAIFNGQCLLVQREPYEFVGGHAAVLNTLVEDVRIAALARRHRLKFATARTDSLGHIRFREVSATVRRGSLRFMLVSLWIGIAILAAALAAALWLPVLVWLILDDQRLAAGIFAILPSLLLLPWYRSWRAVLAPIAIYAMLPILFHSAIGALVGRPVEWKGRTI